MHFCTNCENMLYIRLQDEGTNNLVYYCRNCGFVGDQINKNNICVLQTNVDAKNTAYNQDINEYTKLDPTLPRTKNIKCPNQNCPSNSAEAIESGQNKNEVIYLRYDDAALKYVYICSQCDTIWKTNN